MEILDIIKFEDFHQPSMKDGIYKVKMSISHDITQNGSFDSKDLYFFIAGERFLLGPDLISSHFPPKQSIGMYDNVLPFIELSRSTLPWERIACDSDKGAPWMGLILISENEFSDSNLVKFTKQSLSSIRETLNLEIEPGEPEFGSKDEGANNPNLSVIYLNTDFAKDIIPTSSVLNLLSHVRIAYNKDAMIQEHPSIICNRLPRPGERSKLYLISLEARYNDDGNLNLDKGLTDGKIPFVVLYEWDFISLESERKSHHGGTFLGVCNQLDTGSFRFPDNMIFKDRINESSRQQLLVGGVPVPHLLRGGTKSLSWYRGPFSPVHLDYSHSPMPADLPILSPDILLKYDNTRQMLDISFSAAWELGRLLMLSDSEMSAKMQRWKLSHAQEVEHEEQSLVHSHIPFFERNFLSNEDTELSKSLSKYFQDLRLFKGVPFHYLVPDEAFLPKESIRFFEVDKVWSEYLLDGAFSVGRTSTISYRNEKKSKNAMPHQTRYPSMSGILIRSCLVSDWPAFQVDGYDIVIDSQMSHTDKTLITSIKEKIEEIIQDLNDGFVSVDLVKILMKHNNSLSDDWELGRVNNTSWALNNIESMEYFLIQKEKNDSGDDVLNIYDEFKVPVLRFERLNETVLLVLFLGIVKTIDLHLPVEALHYGVNSCDDQGNYTKDLRKLTDGSVIFKSSDIPEFVGVSLNNKYRLLDIEELKNSISQALNVKELSSGQLGLELLQGTPRKRYTFK